MQSACEMGGVDVGDETHVQRVNSKVGEGAHRHGRAKVRPADSEVNNVRDSTPVIA